MEIGYEGIKKLKEQLLKEKGIKVTIPELLAMSNADDPFYAGSETDKKKANWFAGVWQQLKLGPGTHIRRIHYRIVSLANIKKEDGEVYKATADDYWRLGLAATKAREMELVPAEDFIDRRNPQPIVNVFEEERDQPGWEEEEVDWRLPNIFPSLDTYWELPDYDVYGYRYASDLQPNHIEIWIEKSDMNDVLVPLCQRYDINLVVGVGVQSISQAVRLLKERIGDKPCRILYISDYDKVGTDMPRSVSRQIEYWQYVYGMRDKDIRLTRILLTEDQVIQYNLPPEEVPESDKIGYAWTQEQAIKGKVELDALEAIHPGEFKRIVTEAIEKLRDDDLEDEVEDARAKAKAAVQAAWNNSVPAYRPQLKQLEASIRKVTLKYEPKLQQLNKEMQAELEPLKQQVESLGDALKKTIRNLNVDLPALPEGEAEEEDEIEWLFDSSRDNFEQLISYKRWYNKPWFMDRIK